MAARLIEIDASRWRCILDLYDDVLKHVGAPDWHGESVAALIDSMIYGGINAVEPPYVIRFIKTGGLPEDVTEELRFVAQAIAGARLERLAATGVDVDVVFDIA